MIWAQKPKTDLMPHLRLKGARIHLMPPRPDHCHQWIEVRSRNQDSLKPLEPTWPKKCLDENFFEKRLKRQGQDWQNDHAYALLIFRNDNKDLIGGLNINHVCRGAAQYASLGYWLDRDHQAQGYMSEAMQITLKFAFESLNLHRMNAAVIPSNQRSIKLLVRNGFREEGLAEKYIKINGHWHDHVLFGLPVELWQEHQRSGNTSHFSV